MTKPLAVRSGIGLREKKKEETRTRLVDAGQRLFEKKGFDATTIEEIASAAGVAPRTFFRYFTSKEDLVQLGQDEENAQIAALLKTRPPKQTPLEFLIECTRLIHESAIDDLERMKRSRRLIRETPSLRARLAGMRGDIEARLTTALTPKGASREEALRIHVLVAVYLAATSTVMEAVLDNRIRGSPTEQLEKVTRMLREGFEG
jgi:AcrR family transcriptional regulator